MRNRMRREEGRKEEDRDRRFRVRQLRGFSQLHHCVQALLNTVVSGVPPEYMCSSEGTQASAKKGEAYGLGNSVLCHPLRCYGSTA